MWRQSSAQNNTGRRDVNLNVKLDAECARQTMKSVKGWVVVTGFQSRDRRLVHTHGTAELRLSEVVICAVLNELDCYRTSKGCTFPMGAKGRIRQGLSPNLRVGGEVLEHVGWNLGEVGTIIHGDFPCSADSRSLAVLYAWRNPEGSTVASGPTPAMTKRSWPARW